MNPAVILALLGVGVVVAQRRKKRERFSLADAAGKRQVRREQGELAPITPTPEQKLALEEILKEKARDTWDSLGHGAKQALCTQLKSQQPSAEFGIDECANLGFDEIFALAGKNLLTAGAEGACKKLELSEKDCAALQLFAESAGEKLEEWAGDAWEEVKDFFEGLNPL